MPLVRYEIRNEFSLGNPELYKSAGKDDPEALLEGMAMAGLVGIVRQLGDLAEFAAEIFHDLHEEVMATAARGHGLMIRVQQLEAEFPLVEKALISEKNQLRFAYAVGADWHASIHNDQNHLTQGDLPRFILNAYEECRGPPRLFLLDKFDVAGAGACLKRYTDPSFFKTEWASTELMMAEKAQRQKKARRVKKKGRKQRNGETADVTPINGRVRYSSLDLDRPTYVPSNLMNTSSQKLKSKQLQGYPLLNREIKRDRLKSPLNVSSPKKGKHVPENISCGFDKKLDLEHFNSSPVRDHLVGRHNVQAPDKSLFSKDAHESFSPEWEEKPAVRTVHRVKLSDNHTRASSPEPQSSRITPEMDAIAAKVSPKFIHEEQKNTFVDYKGTSEVDRHYVQGPDKSLFSKDAHESFSQEWEEKPAVRTVQGVKLSDNHTTVSSPESQSSRIIPEMDEAKLSPKFINGERKNAFVDHKRASEVKVDNDENDDVASEADNFMDALATMEFEMETDCESKMKHEVDFDEVDFDFNLENKETGGDLSESCAHFSEFADAEATAFYNCDSSDESSKVETTLRFVSNSPADDASNVESTSYMVSSTSECDSGNVMQNGRLDSARASPETSKNSITSSDDESSLLSDVLENVQVLPDENVESDTDITTIEEKINDIGFLPAVTDAMSHGAIGNIGVNYIEKDNDNRNYFSNASSCAGIDNREMSFGFPTSGSSLVGAVESETPYEESVAVSEALEGMVDENMNKSFPNVHDDEDFASYPMLPNSNITESVTSSELADGMENRVIHNNVDANTIEKENDNRDSFSNASSCAGIDNREMSFRFPTSESSLLGTRELETPYEEAVAISESLEGVVDENMKKSSPNVHDDEDCAGYPTFQNSNITESGTSSKLADGMENGVIHNNIDVNNIKKENDNRDSYTNASSCAGIDNREISFRFPTSGSSPLGTMELETPYEESVVVSESLEGIVDENMNNSSPNIHDDEDCAGYPTFPYSNITKSVVSSELADGMENGVIHDNDEFFMLQTNDAENGVLESIIYEASDTQDVKAKNASRCPSPESVGQISVESDTNIEHSGSAVESMPQGSTHVEYVGSGMESELRDDQSCRERFLDQILALESEMDATGKEEPIEHPCAKETMKSIAMEGEENEEPPEHVYARESESLSGSQDSDVEGSECIESIPDTRPINLQPRLNVVDGYGDDQVTENYSSIIAPTQDSTVCSGDKLTADSDSVSLLEKDLSYDIPMKELKIHSEDAMGFDVDVVKLPLFTCIRDSSSNKELSDKFIHEETSINDVVRPDAALDSRFTELYTDGGSFENCVAIDSHSYIHSGLPTEAVNSPPSADSLSEKVHMDSLHSESKMQLHYGMPAVNPNASPRSTYFDPWTNSGVLKESVEIEPHRNLLFVAPTEICKSSPSANSSSERVHMDSTNAQSDMHILHVIQPVKPIGADAILDVISPVKPAGAEPILDFIPPVKPVGAEPILDFIPPVKPVSNEPLTESPPNFTNRENFDNEPPSPPLEHIKISFQSTSDSPVSMCSTNSDHVLESSSLERREQSQRKVHELCSFSLLPEPAIPLQVVDENPSIQIMGSLSSHRQRNSPGIHISQMRDKENDFEDEESKPFGISSSDFSPVFYNQSLEPTEGLAIFSGRTAVSDADTGSPGVSTNSMSITSSPETTRNSLFNIKCSSADASPSSSHSGNISVGSSPRSFVVSTPHSPVSVEENCHRNQGLSSHSPVLESRAVDTMSSTAESESDCNWHEMRSSPPEACYKNQDSSPPSELGALVQTSSTVEPNSECKWFDISSPHTEDCHKYQDSSSTESPVLQFGELVPTPSTVEPEACHKNQDLSRNQFSVLESGASVLTSSTSEPNSECNWNEMPPPPPLPTVAWQSIKPHQMHTLALLERLQPPSPPALPPLVITKSSMEDGSSSVVPTMQKAPVERHDSLIEAIASHDKTTLKKVLKEIQPIVARPVDEREVLLEQIRSKSFSLRRTSVVKHNIARPVTNINVAAILEKANAIRQAFTGSDEEGDDDWSDA